jgi:hypothetical protein
MLDGNRECRIGSIGQLQVHPLDVEPDAAHALDIQRQRTCAGMASGQEERHREPDGHC